MEDLRRNMRVTHISIIHRALDTRIFRKQCRALASAGYDVHLIAGRPPAEQIDGVTLHPVAAEDRRPLARQEAARLREAARVAMARPSAIYHLHDPHLIPLGVLLKARGAQVIYDVHENYSAHARSKLAHRPGRAAIKAAMWDGLESIARRTFDGFVCASPAVAAGFPADRTVVVGNLPLQSEFMGTATAMPYAERGNTLVTTGYITAIRGFRETLKALEMLPDDLDFQLRLIGGFRPEKLAWEAARRASWRRIELLGWRQYPQLIEELLQARIGLVLLHPLPNHTDAIRSNKLFEYMAAGLPVLASDLPRWREIVCGLGCGLVVDPQDPEAIAEAILYLLAHPEEAQAMGERGQAAVAEQFNWDSERERLLALYEDLIGPPAPAPAGDRESVLSA